MYYSDAAQQTSTVKLAALFQNFQEIVWTLGVSITKVTSRNAFIDNVFTLESEKKIRNFETNFFLDYFPNFLNRLLTIR